MDGYVSEEQQVEQIKKWWARNGRGVMSGVAIGLAVFFGGRYWLDRQAAQTETASVLYAGVLNAVREGDAGVADRGVRQLLELNADGEYASLGSLLLARLKADQGDLDGAQAHLQWVVQNSSQQGLKTLARLRLARILLAQGRTDEAEAQLVNEGQGGFSALFDELRGDILLARQDFDGARKAYARALEATEGKQRWLRMKHDDLTPPGTVQPDAGAEG